MSEGKFRDLLGQEDDSVKAVLLAKLMRQAKPDDVFLYTSEAEIRRLWPRILRHLGQSRAFWQWLLAAWEKLGATHAA